MFLRFLFVLFCVAIVVPASTLLQTRSALAVTQSSGAWALGTLTPGSGSSSSQNFTVVCPGVRAAASGTLWIQPAQGSPRGLLMGFSGSNGDTRWLNGTSLDVNWLSSVNSARYEVVQLQWAQPGWTSASPGEDAGPAHLACRAATVIGWVYDNLYPRLHVSSPRLGICGFCVAGTSAGASQISYALAYYGLGPILNGVFPISGPPHAALAKGCLDAAGYGYDSIANSPGAPALIDSSFGYYNSSGPCVNHVSSFTSRWNQESVDTSGSSYYYPTTRIHFIFGQYDSQVIPKHASDYISRLAASGSPMVTQETVAGMAHNIAGSASGLAALLAAIQSQSSPRPTSPTPSASQSPGSSALPAQAHASPSSSGHMASPGPSAQAHAGGTSPVQKVGNAIAGLSGAIIGGSNSGRVWLVVVVAGLALVLAAVLLTPRLGVVQRALATTKRFIDRTRPSTRG